MPELGVMRTRPSKRKMWISAETSKPNSTYVQCASMVSLKAFTKYNQHPTQYEEITIVDMGQYSSLEIVEALIRNEIKTQVIYFRNNESNIGAIRLIKAKMPHTRVKSQAYGKEMEK